MYQDNTEENKSRYENMENKAKNAVLKAIRDNSVKALSE